MMPSSEPVHTILIHGLLLRRVAVKFYCLFFISSDFIFIINILMGKEHVNNVF